MYDADFWSNVINSVIWPISLFFILLLFRLPIISLINHIKKISVANVNLEIGDTVPIISPDGNRVYNVTPVPDKTTNTEVVRLSEQEIEASKKIAQARIDEDTKKAGFQRGKLRQLPNGKYAVAWDVSLNTQIGMNSKIG